MRLVIAPKTMIAASTPPRITQTIG